jgi:hydroxymethylbilane synthase
VNKPLVLATRRSPLALRQAELVASSISDNLGREVNLLPMVTTGDRQTDWSLEKTGGKGLFTKELESVLLDGTADLAVHSAKDMPSEMPEGLCLSAFLPRENPADVLVIRNGVDTPKTIASGSPRRRSQATKLFPEANWIELRGNVETRLQKIAEGKEADATFLAAAGLNRLGIREFQGLTFRELKWNEMVPAPGQGAIAIQSRIGDQNLFQPLSDPGTESSVKIERTVLTSFGGGCQVALGAYHSQLDDRLYFFHEKCGIVSSIINGRTQAEWIDELIAWTSKK